MTKETGSPLVDQSESLEAQNRRLVQIADALMHRVEQKSEHSGLAYAQFERATLLEAVVNERTRDLERTLDLLQESNSRIAKANAAADAARADLAEAIETIREGFALFGPDGKLVLFNSRFCRGLRDVETALRPGMTFADYVRRISESKFLDLPADETPSDWVAKRMEQHRESHAVLNVKLFQDRWLQVSEHRTDRGGTVILQTDVTDIIRSERQVHDKLRSQQDEIFRATLDHLNQGVCIFDRHRKLVGWNQRMNTVLGLALQETYTGISFSELLVQVEHQIRFNASFDAGGLLKWARQVSLRSPISFEVTTTTKHTLNIFAQEMPDGGFVMSFTDVTSERDATRALSKVNEQLEGRVFERTQELGAALKEAERANASKSRFVAAASHDLLQPLSAAKLFLSSLGDQLSDTEAVDILGKAQSAMFSVEQIIDALLDISKLDSGKAVFDIKSVRLSAILEPLADELAPVADAKGIELRVIPSSLIVQSDPGYLRRILQNLMSNAIRYTTTGKIIVGVRRQGRSARLEVWDTGCGIDPADQASIFQEFKRLDNDGAQNGLGLGLAIVERACSSLDHPLSLWSVPDVGSCFSFNVPIRGRIDSQDTPGHDPANATLPTSLIVLLVENDPQLAQALSIMFDNWNIDMIHAHNAKEALDLLAEIALIPDALILDYQLGEGLDGIALFQEIAQRYERLPTCIISADRTTELRERVALNSLKLISKPIDRGRLFEFFQHVGAAQVS